ncbi:hydrogen peroxide-dependent heme synthase [Arcanobacterium bovis]|uniref:Coproheme decarboxylase n=1 Tax=Arcanobacterium bovis TaxID=2529275 RepID=A0A4Q9V0B3_9ACTO|nr:hydrogen peroxide-dependent heme synthase [Arcanobacterium bovis]TBW22093.1 ferrochelatase [Arcanobacterium bovis]
MSDLAHPNAHKPAYVRDPRDAAGINPDEVNEASNFSLQAVFRTAKALPAAELDDFVSDLEADLERTGVEIRGWYDVGGFRADADLMVWALADSTEKLQSAYHAILQSNLGRMLEPVWSAMAAHIAAEFNQRHLPACFGGVVPRPYVAVYPFNRSWDWYYLPPARRSAMLREHGMNGRDHLDVQISTLAAFALGDYEWTIALEADSIGRIMSVLRKQREAEARLYVRDDTPFFTGPRVELREWANRQQMD